MSGIFDKKTDKANKRQERTLKQQQQLKRTRTITVTVIIVFAFIFAVALLVNSKFIRRALPAVTVGGTSF